MDKVLNASHWRFSPHETALQSLYSDTTTLASPNRPQMGPKVERVSFASQKRDRITASDADRFGSNFRRSFAPSCLGGFPDLNGSSLGMAFLSDLTL